MVTIKCLLCSSYREIPLFVLLGSLPSFLNIEFDVFQQIHSEVRVGADTDCEVVCSLLVGGGELQLHLLLGHQGGQVVRRGDQRVGLPVGDVHPPEDKCSHKCFSKNMISRKNSPEFLLVVRVVWTVHTVRHAGLASQSLFSPVHSFLEPWTSKIVN